MSARIYAYLRASTQDQDANRARKSLEQFVQERGLTISSWFTENESGAKLHRPELFRLIEVAVEGDILLIEQVDRLSRLNEDDWSKLKDVIRSKKLKIVSLDLPTSWSFVKVENDFNAAMMAAINGMMLDMLAVIARKDYTDRRRRQAEGIAKAKEDGRYKGRTTNTERLDLIQTLLKAGKPWNDIQKQLECSRATINKAAKMMRIDVAEE